jgi:hypothetical protein
MEQTSAPAQDDAVVVVDAQPNHRMDMTQRPVVESFSNAYDNGFRACQAIIITKFHDGQQRTRAQWISLIENLKPNA